MTSTTPRRRWTPDELALLGTASDVDIARRVGRPVSAVVARRVRAGIAPHHPHVRPWTKAEDRLLGRLPDAVVARRLGINRQTVTRRRLLLGRPMAARRGSRRST